MRLRTSYVAESVGGTLIGPDVTFDGACADSRSVAPGQLFVPVRGSVDGHHYLGAAVEAGAVAYLTDGPLVDGATAVRVPDTVEALDRLARCSRLLLRARTIGITGSNGKTTTKDLLHAITGPVLPTAASPGSFNNEIGGPLTLLATPDDAELLIVEMGARGRGHIASLAAMARPDIGIVTNVGLSHVGEFGDVGATAVAKRELVEALPPSGTAVLNGDDPRCAAMASTAPGRVVRFGSDGDVRAEEVRTGDDLRSTFRLVLPDEVIHVRLALAGEHQVQNALAAAAAAWVIGVPAGAIAEGLGSARTGRWRMEVTTTPDGGTLINDAYNASPASMAAALRSLARKPARRRIAVLGPMAELGEHTTTEHAAIATLAEELGIQIVAVGTDDYGTAGTGVDQALRAVGVVDEHTVVLVKASRSAGLEHLASALLGIT